MCKTHSKEIFFAVLCDGRKIENPKKKDNGLNVNQAVKNKKSDVNLAEKM